MSKAGESIIQGLKDALAYTKGDKTKGRARKIIERPINVKAIRQKTKLTQEKFAQVYGFSLSNIKKWETGREPSGSAKALLTVIKKHPQIVKKALEKEY